MSVNLKKGIQSLKLFYFRKFQNMPKQRDYNSEPSWLITHCCQSPAPGQPSPLCLRPPPSDGCLQELLPCAPSHLPRMLGSGPASFRNVSRPCQDGLWSALVVGVVWEWTWPWTALFLEREARLPTRWPFFLSLVCSWNAAFPVNCGGFTIEALSHLNGCW